MADLRDPIHTLSANEASGTYFDANTVKAGTGAIGDAIEGSRDDAAMGALETFQEIGTEQDGFVIGYQNGEARAGFQEQTTTEVLDADGNVVSSDTLTYGAYAEADGDLALGVSQEGTRVLENGADLSYSAALDVATDAISGSVFGEFTQETDWGSYGLGAGASFQQDVNGSEVDWSAAVIGEVTYEGVMKNQWDVYAFAEAGVIADPDGAAPHARVGLGKETGIGDLRAGVNQNGGLSATLGLNF